MAATDWPFSITSKFLDTGGAEHLVTVRGQNIEAFATRLHEAATLFPYAGFANGHAAPAAQPEPTPGIVTPIRTGDPTTDAQYRDSASRINRKAAAANGNGHTPKCSTHNSPMRPSKNGGWFCPRTNDDGTYCQTRAA